MTAKWTPFSQWTIDNKDLLISKYSLSDDGAGADSMAFLYDKLQEQLKDHEINVHDEIIQGFDKGTILSWYSFNHGIDNFVKIEENKESENDEDDNMEELLKSVSNKGTRGSENVNGIHQMYEKVENKPQDSKFISFKEWVLTIDELVESRPKRRNIFSADFDKKKTPKREQQIVRRYEDPKDDEESKMSLLTISNHLSIADKGSLLDHERSNRQRKIVESGLNDENDKQNQILDFSSIKKFESSDSTLRKDSSMPDIYTDMPLK